MKIRSAYAYIIFKITDDKKSIVIDCKGEKGASFDDFCSKLPDGDCRYAVLDVEINTKSGATTNKLIFVAWSDDNASIKPKMLYASSKDALKKALTGINEEYQVRSHAWRGSAPRAPRAPARALAHAHARGGPCGRAHMQATDRGDLDQKEIVKKAGGV